MLLNSFKLKKNYSAIKHRFSIKTKKNLLYKKAKFRKSPLMLSVFIPFTLTINITRNNYLMLYSIYLYNKYIKLNFTLPSNYFLIDFNSESNTLTLSSTAYNSLLKQYIAIVLKTFSSLFRISFKKVKFKGKGYYVYKNMRNTIAPQFGYSHRLYIYSWFNSLKFSSKTTLLLFGFITESLQVTALGLKKFRSINVFTGRGVRFSRQCVYSKPGKVSTYR